MIYKTKGTCAREIQIEIQDNVLQEVKFVGGCMGNTLGVASLVKGMKVEDVISKLTGITCGFRQTSCPDQISKALEQFLETHK